MSKKKEVSVVEPTAEIPQKEYLTDKIPNVITAHFALGELLLKDLMWTMKIRIGSILPKSYHSYNMLIAFDEEPYERNIDKFNREISQLKFEKQQPLFEEDTEEKIEEKEKQIEVERRRMSDRRAECPDMEMIAEVEELKYSGGSTIIKFRIPDFIIKDLNENKLKFGSYKMILTPQY